MTPCMPSCDFRACNHRGFACRRVGIAGRDHQAVGHEDGLRDRELAGGARPGMGPLPRRRGRCVPRSRIE
eukprot:10049166-Prorocentrum_lima.AAC.1